MKKNLNVEILESRALLSAVTLNVVANGHILAPTSNVATLDTELKAVGSVYEFIYLGASGTQVKNNSQLEVEMDLYVPAGSNMKGQTLSINESSVFKAQGTIEVGTLTNSSIGVFFPGSGVSTQTYSSSVSGVATTGVKTGFGSDKVSGFNLPVSYTQVNALTFNFAPGADESYSLTSNVAAPVVVPPARVPVPVAPVPVAPVPVAPVPVAPVTVSATVHQLGAHAACDESYIVLQFSGPVNPAVANNVNNYSAVRLCGAVVPFASATYNAISHTVTLIPRSPLIFAAYNPLHVHNTVTAINLTVGSNVAHQLNGRQFEFYLT